MLLNNRNPGFEQSPLHFACLSYGDSAKVSNGQKG
jgi:hypothetical protein